MEVSNRFAAMVILEIASKAHSTHLSTTVIVMLSPFNFNNCMSTKGKTLAKLCARE